MIKHSLFSSVANFTRSLRNLDTKWIENREVRDARVDRHQPISMCE